MTNRPLAYTLSERTATVGALAGKTVIQANPTGRKRIDHRTFCEEVARATTFTGVEVEVVLRLVPEQARGERQGGVQRRCAHHQTGGKTHAFAPLLHPHGRNLRAGGGSGKEALMRRMQAETAGRLPDKRGFALQLLLQ